MDLAECQFLRLDETKEVAPFDCGDGDLNEFLKEDARRYFDELLAVTYLIERQNKSVAFFSVSNDKISETETRSRTVFNDLFKLRFPEGKQYTSYPAVKIGRLAVCSDAQKSGLGTALVDYIKIFFIDKNKTGCRYITVDAYRNSIPFYQKNGFEFLTEKDDKPNSHTRLMYFDLVRIRGAKEESDSEAV